MDLEQWEIDEPLVYEITPEDKVDDLIALYEQIPYTIISEDERNEKIEYYRKSEFEHPGDNETYDLLIRDLTKIIKENKVGGKKSRKSRKKRKSRKSRKSCKSRKSKKCKKCK